MDIEIDLKVYFEAILAGWKLILAAVGVTVLLTFGISSLLPATYQATSLVAVTQPRQLIQFDPRFEALDETQPLRALPEIAMSDALLTVVLEKLPSTTTLSSLKERVEALPGNDPSLVRLSVTDGTPELASEIANLWAEVFVAQANEIYGDRNGAQVDFFSMQQELAEQELRKATSELILFEARNESSTINNKLEALRKTQNAYFDEQRASLFLIDDMLSMQTYLQSSTLNSLTFADQLTAVFLQLKAFDAQLVTSPIDIQLVDAQFATAISKQEQIETLEQLLTILQAASSQMDERLLGLEPQILIFQEQLQENIAEKEKLVRNQKLAEETYVSLSRKVEEERITAQDTSSGVRLASKAAAPELPIRPRRLLNTLVAGILSFFLAISIILVRSWWHDNDTP